MQFFRDVSFSAASAGFVATLVGFTSSVALVFQAAQAFGASEAVIASWMWALGIGMVGRTTRNGHGHRCGGARQCRPGL